MILWNPALDPPRPSNADAISTAEEFFSPRGDNQPSLAFSNRGDAGLAASTVSSAVEASFLPPELQNAPATQPLHAAGTQMAVNNCHMLQYRASRATDGAAQATATALELVTIPASQAPAGPASPGARKGVLHMKTPTFRSAKVSNNKVQPALVTIKAGKHPAFPGCVLHCQTLKRTTCQLLPQPYQQCCWPGV